MPAPQFFCSSLYLRHWRNFQGPMDIKLLRSVYLIGPNASGKSNLLDALRFFRDVAADGLQDAVEQRGGMEEIRTLQATAPSGIELGLSVGTDKSPETWKYRLRFRNHPKKRRPEVVKEEIWHRGELVLQRPDAQDKKDRDQLMRTHLEQPETHRKFRQLNRFLQTIRYRHIVPHLVRARIPKRSTNGREDPFGGDFLEEMGAMPRRLCDARLDEISKALKGAIPQFESLHLRQDADGRWHLEARFEHWGANGARQSERALSDGTLRLIGLLWTLAEGGGPLLLEEPELGLNDYLVGRLAPIMALLHLRNGRQTVLSTHSPTLLSNEGLGLDEVYILDPGEQGTEVSTGSSHRHIRALVEEGNMPVGEALLPYAAPDQNNHWFRFPA